MGEGPGKLIQGAYIFLLLYFLVIFQLKLGWLSVKPLCCIVTESISNGSTKH